MSDPILSREEVEALAHRICMKYEHSEYVDMRRYTFGLLTLEQLARAIESAVLEKVCGEPVKWQARITGSTWFDVKSDLIDRMRDEGAEVRALFALTRSKP
ncbi:hypothetical protein KPB04_12210 [Burkholderia cenocepacia]|uniref:hypothetical protein n=1 Tax=Burkholderia cenocepacia TaxID=95486 RepID=UPI00285CA1C6|nr:hypothetical protein [Burkholderia cenocepacia]MDR8102491.1 hypothetical protein [Burkholderia cenocepacia]